MVETGGEIQRGAASVATHENITFSQMRHGDHYSTHAAFADVFVVIAGEVPGDGCNRDYEVKIEHSEAMIYLSMSKRMLARNAR